MIQTGAIAERSVRRIDDGWTFKVDPNWTRRLTTDGGITPTMKSLPRDMGCPLAVILGGKSRHSSAARLKAIQLAAGPDNVITIEDAGHHVHLDQPMVVAEEVRRILASWSSARGES